MNLTPENKAHIDGLTLEQLLECWRNSPPGTSWFMGESGKYWGERMTALRNEKPAEWVSASKSIGWHG